MGWTSLQLSPLGCKSWSYSLQEVILLDHNWGQPQRSTKAPVYNETTLCFLCLYHLVGHIQQPNALCKCPWIASSANAREQSWQPTWAIILYLLHTKRTNSSIQLCGEFGYLRTSIYLKFNHRESKNNTLLGLPNIRKQSFSNCNNIYL